MAVDLEKVKAWLKAEAECDSPMCELYDPLGAVEHVAALVAEVEGLREQLNVERVVSRRISTGYAVD